MRKKELRDCRMCIEAWYHDADYESSEESGWGCERLDKENDSKFPYRNTKCKYWRVND